MLQQGGLRDIVRVIVIPEQVEDVEVLLGRQTLNDDLQVLLRRKVVLKRDVRYLPRDLVEHDRGLDIVKQEALLQHRHIRQMVIILDADWRWSLKNVAKVA